MIKRQTIKDLLKLICELKCVNPKIIFNIKKPTLPVNIVLSHQKAKKMYDWVPKISLQEGLIKTIHWLENNYDENRV